MNHSFNKYLYFVPDVILSSKDMVVNKTKSPVSWGLWSWWREAGNTQSCKENTVWRSVLERKLHQGPGQGFWRGLAPKVCSPGSPSVLAKLGGQITLTVSRMASMRRWGLGRAWKRGGQAGKGGRTGPKGQLKALRWVGRECGDQCGCRGLRRKEGSASRGWGGLGGEEGRGRGRKKEESRGEILGRKGEGRAKQALWQS